MALQRTFKSGMSLFKRVGIGGPMSANNNNNNARLFNSAIYCGTGSFNSSSRVIFVLNSTNIYRRMLSIKAKPKSFPEVPRVNMGSILGHHKYREMKSKLSKKKSLGPLDTASLYILSSKNLAVNLEILRLDALSPQLSKSHRCKGYAKIKEMKQVEQ